MAFTTINEGRRTRKPAHFSLFHSLQQAPRFRTLRMESEFRRRSKQTPPAASLSRLLASKLPDSLLCLVRKESIEATTSVRSY